MYMQNDCQYASYLVREHSHHTSNQIKKLPDELAPGVTLH